MKLTPFNSNDIHCLKFAAEHPGRTGVSLEVIFPNLNSMHIHAQKAAIFMYITHTNSS